MRPSATLIVGPSWVGDMVIAQTLFKRLKAEVPERALDVLAPAWSLPIVARMPEIRRGIASQTGHGEFGFGKRRRIAKTLRDEGYAQAIVLPRSFKAALIPWLAGIPTRTGYRGESRFFLINDTRPFDKAILDQTVKRFVVLGGSEGSAFDSIPEPALAVSEEHQSRLLNELSLTTERPVIAMMPGAEYGPAKCWPLEHFVELARALDERGYTIWVFGSAKDAAAGEVIAERGHAQNLCGKTSLEDAIDLLALCQQAVSNDSGLMHIAAAVGSHVHSIYGSSSPGFTPPLTAKCNIHYLGLDCSPCFRRECPLGHLNCLNGIVPEAILQSIVAADDKTR